MNSVRPFPRARRPSCSISPGSAPLLAASLLAVAVLFSACAYMLGPTNGQIAGAKSVQVNPFANNALEPRLSEAVTTSIRKSLQRDGTFRLDTKREGDIVL